MLKLENLYKEYTALDFKQTALKGVNLRFKRTEFAAILGPSGSGKTTLLNLIGGLDRYDQGDLIINGKSTEFFKDRDWDAYRNNAIGFIFQSYNLIMHISVVDNVEIGLTLSGMSTDERRKRALALLDRVGLIEHVHKKPSQLSGGQMQRVAIARALANDPDIILADEPTGALDSATSVQIMELIREIAKDKLVIMVTHNRDIAEKYANRIVELLDGHVISDTVLEDDEQTIPQFYQVRHTSMSFKQALKLSFNNLKMKKIRALITAFAGSIGIIGVALVLSISRGLNDEIENMEITTLSDFPLVVPSTIRNINVGDNNPFSPQTPQVDLKKFSDDTLVYNYDPRARVIDHTNVFTDEYVEHLEGLDAHLVNEMFYIRQLSMNVLKTRYDGQIRVLNRSQAGFSELLSNRAFFHQTYDVIYGEEPTEIHQLVLVIDEYNRLDVRILAALGLDTTLETFDFEDIVGMTYQLLLNNDYYVFDEPSQTYNVRNLTALYNDENAITLEIVGIVRIKPTTDQKILRTGLKHLPELTDLILLDANESDIALFQSLAYTHAITGAPISAAEKEQLLRVFGADSKPVEISIYARDFSSKKIITAYLDRYNAGKPQDEQIIYVDQAAMITDTIGTVVDTTTIVLVAFSAIALLVSSIMIGVITYISVLERTREIGILRSLGARKRDITRVFNAETTIVGLASGVMGVVFAMLLSFPIDFFISQLVDGIDKLSRLTFGIAVILILISILLTFISGLIPALIASRKNPVEALQA